MQSDAHLASRSFHLRAQADEYADLHSPELADLCIGGAREAERMASTGYVSDYLRPEPRTLEQALADKAERIRREHEAHQARMAAKHGAAA